MIAPLQEEEKEAPVRSPALRRAHLLLAATFFRTPSHSAETSPAIPAWKAWIFAAWVVIVVALYFAAMAGWWRG